jgi:hypothetical protein
MAVLNWETDASDITPDTCEFGISFNSLIHTSSLSGISQTMELPGARWRLKLSFKDLEPTESRVLISFLTRLRGSAGRFYCYDFGRATSRGDIDDTVLVAIADSVTQVTLKDSEGGAVNGSLEVGDYISIGNDTDRELKMITNDLGGDSYNIEPGFRKTLASYTDDPVAYTKGLATFMLSSDEQAYWSTRSKALITDIDIDAYEVFLPAGA